MVGEVLTLPTSLELSLISLHSITCVRVTMITKELLRHLRNDLPMPVTIAALGTEGPPAKRSEGRYRFLCPHCQELLATVNPRNNLAHCFGCKKNLNNIDLLITLGYDFKSAVSILMRMYEQHRARLPQAEVSTASN
jgi:DNA primase